MQPRTSVARQPHSGQQCLGRRLLREASCGGNVISAAAVAGSWTAGRGAERCCRLPFPSSERRVTRARIAFGRRATRGRRAAAEEQQSHDGAAGGETAAGGGSPGGLLLTCPYRTEGSPPEAGPRGPRRSCPVRPRDPGRSHVPSQGAPRPPPRSRRRLTPSWSPVSWIPYLRCTRSNDCPSPRARP